MNVVDLHPEELIDKLHDGSLTATERERLDIHLAQCSACRFEIAIRADLAEDQRAIAERPQLTFASGTPGERSLPILQEEPAPAARVSPSIRARSRRRWPLSLLAAALVLSAGGAMAAVMTGAVRSHWLGWSPQPKPAGSGAVINEAKPSSKPKRVASTPATAVPVQPEVVASRATPLSPNTPEPATLVPPLAAASSSIRSAAPAHRHDLAPTAPDQARSASVTAFPAVSAVAPSSDASAPGVDAASLFADANRARRDGNVDRAVGLYRTLQSRYPNSSESELSRALLAQLLLDRGNPEAALAGFDRYLAEDSPVLSAEALVGRARALEQLGKSSQAEAAWRQVQSRFPGSVHARLAATRLAALGTR